MTIERKAQDLYEALDELRRQAHETLRSLDQNHPGDAVDDVLDGELSAKIKLVTECAEDLKLALIEREERAQDRRDGYGSAE